MGLFMLAQEQYTKNIIEKLSLLELYVRNSNLIRLLDTNIVAENFFANLFSILFESEYINANLFSKNIASIDIVDNSNFIAVQVTSDTSSTKIKDTIDTFEKNEYYKQYKILKFLFLKPKKKSKKDYTGKPYNIEFIDIQDICKQVEQISTDIDKLKAINHLVNESVSIQTEKDLFSSLVISTEDIKDILDILEANDILSTSNKGGLENNFKEYPGLKQKNSINNIKDSYFDNAILPNIPSFYTIETFLKNPRNIDYCDKYYNVATEIKNKLLTLEDKYSSFDEAISVLYDIISQKVNIKRKNMIWLILHYMYCQCDIGRSK